MVEIRNGLPYYPPETNTPISCKDCTQSCKEDQCGVWCEWCRTTGRDWDDRWERCPKPWKDITWIKFKR